jgi:hypothetical protein
MQLNLGELCQRLSVPYRHARYVLEQRILPRGVEEKPGRGDHRQLDPAQAFWLGIVLMLKQSGVKTPMAGEIADFARQTVREVTQNLNWGGTFEPFLGRLETENQWCVDIGDLKYLRLVTTANPSHQGLYEFPWSEIGKPNKKADGATPAVTIRVDLTCLARLLRK